MYAIADSVSCFPSPLLAGVCPAGYTTAGADCDDVDECVANNGHGPCQDVCLNTDGSFKCACDVS